MSRKPHEDDEPQGKLLMRVDVIETEDAITVKMITASRHLETCTNCLAMFSLRISHAIAEHVADLEKAERDDDDGATKNHNALH